MADIVSLNLTRAFHDPLARPRVVSVYGPLSGWTDDANNDVLTPSVGRALLAAGATQVRSKWKHKIRSTSLFDFNTAPVPAEQPVVLPRRRVESMWSAEPIAVPIAAPTAVPVVVLPPAESSADQRTYRVTITLEHGVAEPGDLEVLHSSLAEVGATAGGRHVELRSATGARS